MSAFTSPAAADLVARLRAAGCVFAEDEARLLQSATPSAVELEALVERRVTGEPLEYVLGWAEFHGLRIAVEPGVFVPRHRTEFMVDRAIDLIRETGGADGDPVGGRTSVVLDLCCGSGAIGLALMRSVSDLELHAADVDPDAVRCARRNVGVDGQVYQGDLFDPLPSALRGRVHILVANVPYVPTEAIELMPPEARLYEAPVALDGGADGLDVLRRVSAAAPLWLAPGGHLLVETSEQQAPLAVDAFTQHGLTTRIAGSEELGATIVIGTNPKARTE